MMKTKLCIAADSRLSPSIEAQIPLIAEAGFNGIFFPCAPDLPVETWIKTARGCALEVQSLHAPFGGCRDLWDTDEEKAEEALEEILHCIRVCGEYGVPIAVSHAYIGFDGKNLPKEKGLARYGRLVEAAGRAGITLAFENTEGEVYLSALLSAFGDLPHVGFCFDTGHALCYNAGTDLLSKYGRMLVCTHLNDNLGVRDLHGEITWKDDLHLLPFDGIADWDGIARGLAGVGFSGPLTFELSTASKPNRHENDLYAAMQPEVYLALAYSRACRVRALFEKYQNGTIN